MPTISTTEEKPQSLLEQIRTTNKAKKAFRNQMSDDSFIIPQFKPIEQCGVEIHGEDFFESPNVVKHLREDHKLTYNHYIDCSQKADKQQLLDIESQHFMNFSAGESKSTTLDQKLISGYDGFGGVHDNLLWAVAAGFTYYTLNNKLIIENTKTREQTVLADATVQLSCLAGCDRYIAVGEGSANAQGGAAAWVYNVETKRLLSRLPFHQRGIQSMAFSHDSKYLITLGVQGDDMLAIWDVAAAKMIKHSEIKNQATNQVRVDHPHPDYLLTGTEFRNLQFVTVGNDAALTTWSFDVKTLVLEAWDASPPEHLKNIPNVHFVSVEFTEHPANNAGPRYAVVGASNGSLVAYDFSNY